MSFKNPSQVSATMGRDHQYPLASADPWLARQEMTASRTMPTLWVLVIRMGPSANPDSSIQVVPVISPLPFKDDQPAKQGSSKLRFPLGRIAVTPVRTGPFPTVKAPSPRIIVAWPTSTPFTSVMALNGPGFPSKGIPKSRALTGCCP